MMPYPHEYREKQLPERSYAGRFAFFSIMSQILYAGIRLAGA
jgi:hypothetical protein